MVITVNVYSVHEAYHTPATSFTDHLLNSAKEVKIIPEMWRALQCKQEASIHVILVTRKGDVTLSIKVYQLFTICNIYFTISVTKMEAHMHTHLSVQQIAAYKHKLP